MELLALLFAVGFAVKFWFIIAAIIGLIAAAYWGRRAVDRHAERVAAERHRLAGLVIRADQQDAWIESVMSAGCSASSRRLRRNLLAPIPLWYAE